MQPPKMTIHARARGPGNNHYVFEGDAPMSQEQQDKYAAVIGNGLAKVNVGRDLGEKDFGSGGGVIVNISLTCDQSEVALNQAISLAHQLADQACWYYHQQLKQQLLQAGILQQ